jgi:enterochelin esterase-like enzyme
MQRRTALGAIAACLAASCRKTDSAPVGVTSASEAESAAAPGSASASGSASGSASATGSASGTASAPQPAPYPQDAAKRSIANDELALHDWALPGDPKISKRCVVLVPKHLAVGERVPLLVALHGLAETIDETMGAYAWVDKYGVGEGYAHLRAPDTMTIESLGKMMKQDRLDALHAELAKDPFRGMVIACPYTPNIWKVSPDVESTIGALSDWLFDVLVPRLRAETPVRSEREFLGLDGVSLGGYASLGVGIRRAADLGSIGCVQAAISQAEAPSFADRFAKSFAATGARPLHLLTSTADVFRKPVEALDKALAARKVAHDFRLAIGPHDQPFLRGPGSVEMLLWHARALAG